MARADRDLIARLLDTPLDALLGRGARPARWARGAHRPARMTFSPKVFIPLTKLCADVCHYCTFATTPSRLKAPFMSEEEVLEVARAGAAAGCKEALFTLGDAPERRYAVAQEWLEQRGFARTIDYVRHCARAGARRKPGCCRTSMPACSTKPITACCARSRLRPG